MEATRIRSEGEILHDLKAVANVTVQGTYVDVFRGKPVVHIPMNGEMTYYFSFGIEKAELLERMVESGEFACMMNILRDTQKEIDKKNAKKAEVIQL
jgi:hypothetical protein